MRFKGWRAKNMGVFRGEHAIDLSSLSGVIALVGANGSGKTTALELLAGTLFRKCPTRGTLKSLATDSDSFSEVEFEWHGQPYRVRQLVDAVHSKSEALVTNGTSAPILSTGKVAEYDEWRRSHLLDEDVFFAGPFSAQQSAGFFGMGATERKTLLLRALRLDRIEALADRCREHEREAKVKLATINARLEDERARSADVATAESQVQDLSATCTGHDLELELARSLLAGARTEAETARQAREAYDATIRLRAELSTKIQLLDEGLADKEERLRNNRNELANADKIRAAVTRVTELEQLVTELEKEAAVDEQKRRAAGAEADGQKRSVDAAQGRAVEARARIERLTKRLADREKVLAAAAALEQATDQALAAEQAVFESEQALEQLRAQRVTGAEERVEFLRGGLGQIAAGAAAGTMESTGCGEVASETLRVDDMSVEHARTLPASSQAAAAALHAAKDRAAVVSRRRADLERLAQSADELDRAASDLEAARAQEDAALAEARDARASEQSSRAIAAQFVAAARSRAETVSQRRSLLEEARIVAKRADRLAGAEGRIAELEPQRDAMQAERAALTEKLSATPEPATLPPPAPDVAAFERTLAAEESAASRARVALAIAERNLEEARAAAERLAVLDAERVAVEADLADWSRLAQDLGKGGLQALELDSAIGELNELSNSLLHRCHSSRWTIRFDTQRLSGDGKRMIESLEVYVLDTERGREAPAETFSGGEVAILSEAVSLALTMVACRRAGLEGCDLIRDESGAALDPQNARAYLQMLREAMKYLGSERVLIVSHNADVSDACDARIRIEDGTISIH